MLQNSRVTAFTVKDHVQMVTSVDLYNIFHFISFFNASATVIFLLSSSSYATISGLSLDFVLLNWSKVLSNLIQFTDHHVPVEVNEKRVNCGFGLGLEIKVNYFFMEMQEIKHG